MPTTYRRVLPATRSPNVASTNSDADASRANTRRYTAVPIIWLASGDALERLLCRADKSACALVSFHGRRAADSVGKKQQLLGDRLGPGGIIAGCETLLLGIHSLRIQVLLLPGLALGK
jgi:hypothetical protein